MHSLHKNREALSSFRVRLPVCIVSERLCTSLFFLPEPCSLSRLHPPFSIYIGSSCICISLCLSRPAVLSVSASPVSSMTFSRFIAGEPIRLHAFVTSLFVQVLALTLASSTLASSNVSYSRTRTQSLKGRERPDGVLHAPFSDESEANLNVC